MAEHAIKMPGDCEPRKEDLAIRVGEEDRRLSVAAGGDVVEESSGERSGSAGHGPTLRRWWWQVSGRVNRKCRGSVVAAILVPGTVFALPRRAAVDPAAREHRRHHGGPV